MRGVDWGSMDRRADVPNSSGALASGGRVITPTNPLPPPQPKKNTGDSIVKALPCTAWELEFWGFIRGFNVN